MVEDLVMKRLDEVVDRLTRLDAKVEANQATTEEIARQVRGDPHWDRPGLLQRVKALEGQVLDLSTERDRFRWLARGAGVGLGLLGVTNIGTLAAVVRLLNELIALGVSPP